MPDDVRGDEYSGQGVLRQYDYATSCVYIDNGVAFC